MKAHLIQYLRPSIKEIEFITKSPQGWVKYLYCKEHQYRLPSPDLYINSINTDLTISKIQ